MKRCDIRPTDKQKPSLKGNEKADLETIALSTDPEFLELIESSRARHTLEGGLSSAEIRRYLKDELE